MSVISVSKSFNAKSAILFLNWCEAMEWKLVSMKSCRKAVLRDIFESVVPGYHMNKQHWNTVILDGTVPEFEINRMIDRSYGLVVKKLKKAERTALEIRCGSEALYS